MNTKHYSHEEYTRLRKNAEILSKDKFGDKVLLLKDGTILKLFRVKRLFSSARIVPYSIRFANNAKNLAELNIPSVKIIDIYKIPSIKRLAVQYEPLKGVTLRNFLKRNPITPQSAKHLARFIANLHKSGVFFRSIHFANILVLPDGNFGLIDISDMMIIKRALRFKRRIRNFYHFTRYAIDQHFIAPELDTFIHEYINASNIPGRQANKLKTTLDEIFNPKKMTRVTRMAFLIYTLVWKMAAPLLRLNHRLAQGFDQRLLKQINLRPADIWIQSASAGEAYLAREIITHLNPASPAKLFMTSNTKQGLDILNQTIGDAIPHVKNLNATTAYFPFDSPDLMKKAINTVKPKMIVLLESEIWPGFLYEAKKFGCKIFIINGRITAKSLQRYLIWHSLWKTLKPEKVLAISKQNAMRFKKLFKLDHVDVMPNIKFDRIHFSQPDDQETDTLLTIVQPGPPFLVLGSVRKEEEKKIEKIIRRFIQKQPDTVIGLFPRHLSRIQHWAKQLNRLQISWVLRSQITEPVSKETLILWDTFGELQLAYKRATAVFVGGSLEPLGGQNFLEPLGYGVAPVIGPFWDNFSWVGSEIFTQNLVRMANNWEEVADILLSDITSPPPRNDIYENALKYVADHRGGTSQATNLIKHFLN